MLSFSLFKHPREVLLEIAKRAKNKRKQAGYTQAELASKSGVSLGSLKRFEQSGEISLRSLLHLAHVLDCLNDFDVIFEEKESIKNP